MGQKVKKINKVLPNRLSTIEEHEAVMSKWNEDISNTGVQGKLKIENNCPEGQCLFHHTNLS